MKKLALAFSSKDRRDLWQQSLPIVSLKPEFDLHIVDGSEVVWRPSQARSLKWYTFHDRIRGGADAAIVYSLSMMLKDEENYDYVGLLEQDVLLDPDWLEPTLALFDQDIPVGAVSARSYEDRVLFQRDGHAVMHNVGGGHVILTREAAQIVLANYRTGWWPENRSVFSMLSGVDIGKFAAFHHNEQSVTADWSWDAILAAHGLATLALTPSKATMIGQEVPLEQIGLKLVTGPVESRRDDEAYNRFRANLFDICDGLLTIPYGRFTINSPRGHLVMAHHIDKLAGIYEGEWRTVWSQALGPFGYVAGKSAGITIPLFGSCAFHVAGGKVRLHDAATGYNAETDLTGSPIVTMPVPRDLQHGLVTLELSEGATFYGVETIHQQPTVTDTTFDYSKLPGVKE